MSEKNKSVIAKSDDGTIQLTFTILFSEIKEKRGHVLKEMAETTEVPGFRKGKAPLDRVMEQVSQNKLLENTLSHILPILLSKAVEEYKIKPIIYPKFELVSAEEGKDWQIRATTCETPSVDLGNYKKEIQGAGKAKSIWTPDKGGAEKKEKELSREEKEQELLKKLVSAVKIKIPKVLVQEEVDNRLSNLLSRLEKLGLSLESYLTSTGKTAEEIRHDYEKISEEGLAIDFILGKIAEAEGIQVDDSEIDTIIKSSGSSENFPQGDVQEQKNLIGAILRRRKALDYLISIY